MIPRAHRAAGDLPDALRAWADHLWLHADLAAKARIPTHMQLTNSADLRDPWSHLSRRERRLLEAVVRANIWEPPLPEVFE